MNPKKTAATGVVLARALAARSICIALLAAAALLAPAGHRASAASAIHKASPLTDTFKFDGAVTQTVVVPEGATSAQIRAVGGKGGGAWSLRNRDGDFFTGGDGAQVTGTLAVTAGQVLQIKVGEFGGDADGNVNPGKGGWGATGTGGRGGGSSSGDGAGGGGATSVGIADCESCKLASVLIAGGGGGAGGVGVSASLSHGGPGGSSGTTVDSGHNGKGLGAGKGGASGASGSGNGIGGGNGGNAGGAGGGGGAGLRGGGGGGGSGVGGGGGGGGAAGSSLHWDLLKDPQVVRGATGDGNGVVEVTWNHVAAPRCEAQTVTVPADSPGIKVQLRCLNAKPATQYRIVSLPSHGLLDDRDLAAGTFTYVPKTGFTGTDSMEFQGLTGDQVSAPATVTFKVDGGSAAAGQTITFDYVGAAVTVRPPDWASFAEVTAIGGKGGGSYQFSDGDGKYWTGGDGAKITGEFAVNPSRFVTVRVGQYGGDSDLEAHPGDGGWGATGRGGRGGTSASGDAGGGGGSTSVTENGALVLVAGGGGGAGGRGLAVPGQEPGPGGSSGVGADGTGADPGHDGKGAGHGKGGAGGASGTATGGGGGNGSSLGGGGGGGGSGVRGGNGGGGGGFGGGGGGGGGAGTSEVTSLLHNSALARGTIEDGNGAVKIVWLPATPDCQAQTVAVTKDSAGAHVQLRCDRALMTYVLDTYPKHGFLDDRQLDRGTFTYVPLSGFTGTDTLTFQGDSHGVLSAPTTVTFEVS